MQPVNDQSYILHSCSSRTLELTHSLFIFKKICTMSNCSASTKKINMDGLLQKRKEERKFLTVEQSLPLET